MAEKWKISEIKTALCFKFIQWMENCLVEIIQTFNSISLNTS